MRTLLQISLLLSCSVPMAADGLVPLPLKLPKPSFTGTPPKPPTGVKLEPGVKEIRPPFMVAKGLTNLAFEKPVVAGDREPVIGEISQVTDGDKEGMMGSYVELAADRRWVQIDLGAKRELHAVVFWFFHGEPVVYKDVIVQVSDDVDFITGVKTLFNNDLDNSSGFGVGKDYEYYETHQGKLVDARKDNKPVVARFVRIGCNGSTAAPTNRFTEVEVWGRALKNGK